MNPRSLVFAATVCSLLVISQSQKAFGATTSSSPVGTSFGAPTSVRDFGAKGDGATNDTAAIQAALAFGGDVYFPPGTYIIRPTDPSYKYTFLHHSGNTRIHGAGMGVSTLKVADNVGPYDRIFVAVADASNLTFSDLTIDGNIANNPIGDTAEINAHAREAIRVESWGAGAVIERVEFRNMSSINTIVTGAGVEQVAIRHCAFRNIGKDPNNIPHDHSTIYAHSNRVQILGNTFVASGANDPGAIAAIETHSTHSIVSENLIVNYLNGMNITGVHYEDSQDSLVTNNVIRGAANGIMLWSVALDRHTSGYGLNGLIVSNNIIELTQTKYGSIETHGIALEANANLPVKNVAIKNNVIRFELEESPRKVPSPESNNGITVWTLSLTLPLEDITIAGNTIENSPAAAIRLTANLRNVMVAGNLVRNPGSTKDAPPGGYLSGVACIVHAADTVIVRDNVIVDDLPTTRMQYGIFGLSGGESQNVQWVNNVVRVSGSVRTVFVAEYGNSGHNIKPLIVGVSGTFVPPIYAVQGGSHVTERTTGKEWILPQDGGYDRWIVRAWGGGPPAVGTWRRGDIVWNTGVVAGEPIGWVCIATGTPGSWKAITYVAP
jgi:hypothetical protein